MTHNTDTARYLKRALVVFVGFLIIIAMDTMLWWHVTSNMTAMITAQERDLRSAGWTVDITKTQRRGWPLGAWVTLKSPRLRHERSSSAPFDAGWSGQTLTLGGFWPEFLRSGLPASLSGRHAARLVSSDLQATILATDIHLRVLPDNTLIFQTPSAQLAFTSRFFDQTLIFSGLSGRLMTDGKARPDSTRLGLQLASRSIKTSSPDTFAPVLYQPRFAVALTSSTHDSSGTFFSLTTYDRLLLQTASFSLNGASDPNRISVSGSLKLPEFTGHLTLTALNWQRTAEHILTMPSIMPKLAPELQASLNNTLQSHSQNTQPLTVDIPVSEGRFPLFLETLLQNISTQKIDASHLRE